MIGHRATKWKVLRVEPSFFWQPSSALTIRSHYVFIFLSWQIKHLSLRGRYHCYTVPICPGSKKSCKFLVSIAAPHTWYSTCWLTWILLNIQADEADWLLSNALGASGLERQNVPAAGVWLNCRHCLTCPAILGDWDWGEEGSRNQEFQPGNAAWRGPQVGLLTLFSPHVKCPVHRNGSFFAVHA